MPAPTNAQIQRRLEQLYEISMLFASQADVGKAFQPVVEIATRTLPLRSAILMKTDVDRPLMMVWPLALEASERMQTVRTYVETAYAVVAGGGATAPGEALPAPAQVLVVPLVVADQPAFGVLQIEADRPLDDTDRIFVHAIAAQLAIAFDRDHARQQDISRRQRAEEGRSRAEHLRAHAEVRGARAERERALAERASDGFEALATENGRLYAEAQRAVQVRDDLLAIVSHDLRSPLWTILMATDVLAAGGDPTSAVERIRRAAQLMVRLIEDLLDFASIEAGRLSIRRRPQDPAGLLRDAVASAEAAARAKGLTLTIDLPAAVPPVHGDADRLLQVLANLTGNALRVTGRGGRISLAAEAKDGEVLFTVADNGPGIDAAALPHLFERYWRGDAAAYKGSGLGLAIARGIVNAHDGRIWATSTLGHGATFQFTVPIADVTLLFAAPLADETGPIRKHP